jgi:hypothetical protein
MSKELEDNFAKIDALVAADKAKIELEQEDAQPEQIEIAEASDADEPEKQDDVTLGIQSLKDQLEASTKAKIDAERRATEAAQRANRAIAENEDSNLRLIDTAITNVKREIDGLKVAYRDAMAVGDYDKVAEINDVLMTNKVNLSQLENGKVTYQNRPKQQVQASSDPVERFASQLSPNSANWVRAHPDFVTNPAKQREMYKAHEAAERNGIVADSPQYFNFVESWLDVGQPVQQKAHVPAQHVDPVSQAVAAPVRRQAPPSPVPVSRQGASTITNPTMVTLSADEREIAKMSGMTPKQYAVRKAELLKEGKIGKSH